MQEISHYSTESGKQDSCVLVINCGSSSLKSSLIATESEEAVLSAVVDKLGSEEATLEWTIHGARASKPLPGMGLEEAVQQILSIIPDSVEVIAIGHRVVHGAESFAQSVVIDEGVLAVLEKCSALAPLHNPANLSGIAAARKVFSEIPHVAVFDTAFHQTLPKHAFLYPVPYEWYKEHAVRRYGFHGTSHRYVAQETAQRLDKAPSELSCIIAHLGNGCSACAVEKGKSVDTTMGLSPLEGLVMGTRSGDVDPALAEFISNRLGWPLERIMTALNKESGLLGISGQSNDMRTLVTAMEQGDERAALAIEVFAYRLAKAIMALTAALSQLDAIVFTGGIGENAPVVRAKTLGHLKILNAQLDEESNACNGKNNPWGRISVKGHLLCLVVPTNEELMIARDTLIVTQQ